MAHSAEVIEYDDQNWGIGNVRVTVRCCQDPKTDAHALLYDFGRQSDTSKAKRLDILKQRHQELHAADQSSAQYFALMGVKSANAKPLEVKPDEPCENC